MIQTVVNHFGRLDGCFNNAGLGVWASSIDNMKIDEFEKIIRVNTTGVLIAMKYPNVITAASLPMQIRNSAVQEATHRKPL